MADRSRLNGAERLKRARECWVLGGELNESDVGWLIERVEHLERQIAKRLPRPVKSARNDAIVAAADALCPGLSPLQAARTLRALLKEPDLAPVPKQFMARIVAAGGLPKKSDRQVANIIGNGRLRNEREI